MARIVNCVGVEGFEDVETENVEDLLSDQGQE